MVVFRISLALYLIAGFCLLRYLRRGQRSLLIGGTLFHLAAVIIQGLGFSLRWRACSCFPMVCTWDFSVVVGLVAGLLFFSWLIRYGWSRMGLVFTAIPSIILFPVSFLPTGVPDYLEPLLRSSWFYLHTSLTAVSEAFFAVAAGVGVIYLFNRRGDSPGRPILMEEFILRMVRGGYLLFTAGALFAGSIWSYQSKGMFWSWNSREVEFLIIWLLYTVILHRAGGGRWGGRALAICSLAVFILWIFFFLNGLHRYS